MKHTRLFVWQSWLRSLRESWHLPWFPYLLPLGGGWAYSSGDERESVWPLAPFSIPSANWAGGSGSLALHLQIALWLGNPRPIIARSTYPAAGVQFLAGSDYN